MQLLDRFAFFLAQLLVDILVELFDLRLDEQLVVVEPQLLDVREGHAKHVGLVEAHDVEEVAEVLVGYVLFVIVVRSTL